MKGTLMLVRNYYFLLSFSERVISLLGSNLKWLPESVIIIATQKNAIANNCIPKQNCSDSQDAFQIELV